MTLSSSPTVLVVDDEELLRDVTMMMIEDNGGKSLCAVDGIEAIKILNDKKESIDVVLLDFSMPKMNGYETYLKMKEINPEIKVIIISGLQAISEIEELVAKGEINFMGKPFREKDLVEAINRVAIVK